MWINNCEKHECRRAQVSDPAGRKQERRCPGNTRRIEHERLRMEVVARVIEHHEHNDQAAQQIDAIDACRACARETVPHRRNSQLAYRRRPRPAHYPPMSLALRLSRVRILQVAA